MCADKTQEKEEEVEAGGCAQGGPVLTQGGPAQELSSRGAGSAADWLPGSMFSVNDLQASLLWSMLQTCRKQQASEELAILQGHWRWVTGLP